MLHNRHVSVSQSLPISSILPGDVYGAQYGSQQLPANSNSEKMNSTIVKKLLITGCISVIVAQDKQSCKEVVPSNEVQKVTVLGSGTGCQYRVISDSGKAVKVYVNATSGTKCVKVSSDAKSETLCPLGVTNQFISSSPIEVSADDNTTSSETTTIKPTGVPSEPTTQPTNSSDVKQPTDAGEKEPAPQKPPVVTHPMAPEENGGKHKKGDNAKVVPSRALLRKARDNSETN
ncbi:unnamed protein product [Echinostoma caproni]|uniref:I-set domain-containing protein n=1 Tax=Echinostoma caproni TaxID=27848 RepID=A0A183AFI3_9TREM|nr:unnamed protein product [Echinostoma caproni]